MIPLAFEDRLRVVFGYRLESVPRIEGSTPSTPDRSALPTGFADCRLSRGWTALAVVAVPGRVRRPHGALRFRIGGGRSGQSDPLMAARMAFPRGISGAGATPEAVASCENTLASTPHRAFGEGGCSRHGPCGPSGNGRAGRMAGGRCVRGGCTSAAV